MSPPLPSTWSTCFWHLRYAKFDAVSLFSLSRPSRPQEHREDASGEKVRAFVACRNEGVRCHVPGNYFLKELGIGEYDMPIAGMLSVSDGSELEEDHSEWAAREWFVVQKAEVRMAQDETLIPHVK